MRLFIAIEFSQPVRKALCAAMDGLRRQGVSGNYTRPENLHLTLAFIGEVSGTDDIRRVMDTVRCTPFRLALSGAGQFDDLLWAGVESCHPLTELADTLCRSLRQAGFAIEKMPFKPHITLVRRASADRHYRLEVPDSAMTVTHITLMKSERIDGRLTYTPVYVRPL